MAAANDLKHIVDSDGHFRRKASTFRSTIEPGGKHPPEPGRYFLYVSYACPWAHRSLIVRKLKGLEDLVGLSVVYPVLGPQGWSWTGPSKSSPHIDGVVPDPLYGAARLRELYEKAEPGFEGRVTVPVLWDAKEETIVNNESAEIIRIFNHAFDGLLDEEHKKVDLYPEPLRAEIDELNSWVYDTVNNGVYKTGFATTQEAYDANIAPLFASLHRLDGLLSGRRHLVGDRLTESDVRLYTTVARFDVAYHGAFKCNVGTVRHDFPNLHRWLRELYWKQDAFKQTTRFDHIKTGYYSMPALNPNGIVPKGPAPDLLPL